MLRTILNGTLIFFLPGGKSKNCAFAPVMLKAKRKTSKQQLSLNILTALSNNLWL
ncbi:hypothetical protein RG47T_4429 [Mucilaginibacter polytrichastri]|uniref:Uncharacterized protein n=1 Tax=Mucilaginibacter polytrichastri TaxID=1302689 RepID=A0A1Q6A4K8_9SPHI|nr:hypothetical protein RG47T_4429 [Mucilaginibacter polytrichastri]